MSRLFKLTHAAQQDTFQGRLADAVDETAFLRFIDARRERGFEGAKDVFPTDWAWFDDDGPVRPALDLVPSPNPGLVVSERAWAVVEPLLPTGCPHIALKIEGVRYHWFQSPRLETPLASVIAGLAGPIGTITTLLPRSIVICSGEFEQAWTGAGLSGAQFEPV